MDEAVAFDVARLETAAGAVVSGVYVMTAEIWLTRKFLVLVFAMPISTSEVDVFRKLTVCVWVVSAYEADPVMVVPEFEQVLSRQTRVSKVGAVAPPPCHL
ncbi:MAG: hypothetical protein Q8R26_00815 [bacterium]|nr:hypothetical protein [bacterium]